MGPHNRRSSWFSERKILGAFAPVIPMMLWLAILISQVWAQLPFMIFIDSAVPPPTIDLNFLAQTQFGCGQSSTTFGGCLTAVRSTTNATNLLPTYPTNYGYTTFPANTLRLDTAGLLIEEARTNQLLNSTAPATQTTGSLANATYQLWVNGAGSATMSAGTATGCGTGTATQGFPVTFTTTGTAGTCVVTVTGTLYAFQLESVGTENAQSGGTSLIVTTGSTGTRNADEVSTTSGANRMFLDIAQGTVVIKAGGVRATPLASLTSFLMGTNSGNRGVFLIGSTGVGSTSWNVASGALNLPGTYTRTLPIGACMGYDGTGRMISANGSTTVTDALSTNTVTAFLGQSSAGVGAYNGYIQRVRIYNTRLTSAQCQMLSAQ